jgi:hypothetical protein
MMRLAVKLRRFVRVHGFVAVVILFVGGCTTPPSVAPLLRVSERALMQESDRLRGDSERDEAYIRQTLQVLEEAYTRDLEQVESLTPKWVMEATKVYVAARETIVEHRSTLARERSRRSANLRSAALATRRAIALIEQQDRLLKGVVDEDLRRLIPIAGLTLEE